MHRDDIALHYAYFKANGKQYRIMTTNFPKLIAGNRSSDYFGFFGLGSGEFTTHRIEGLQLEITPLEVDDLQVALLYWRDNPRFLGFVDAAPQHKPIIILAGGDRTLYNLPINWEVYTQLGVQAFAKETLSTFARSHIAYATPEENKERVATFLHYARLF